MSKVLNETLDSIKDEPIEYQIYALDKTISKHKKLDLILSTPAKMANNAIIKDLVENRDNLVLSLEPDDIDVERIEVIRSLVGEEKYNCWLRVFKDQIAKL